MYKAMQLGKLSQSSCLRFISSTELNFFLRVSVVTVHCFSYRIVSVDINFQDSAKISAKISANGLQCTSLNLSYNLLNIYSNLQRNC